MATLYVNNGAAADGWGAGNDTTGTGTQAAPYATLATVETVATTGDSCCVKPCATPYTEDSASGYLNWSKTALIYGDPTLVARDGKPVIQAVLSGAIRIINCAALGQARELRDVILDAQLRAGQKAVTHSSDSLTYTRVQWRNMAASCFNVPSGAAALLLDGCQTESSNTSTTVFDLNSANITSLTVEGGTYFAPAGANGVFHTNALAVPGNVIFSADASGAMIDFTGSLAPYNIRFNGTVGGNLTISGTKNIGTPGGLFPNSLTVTGTTTISGNTFTDLTARVSVRVTQLTTPQLTISGNTYAGTRGFGTITSRTTALLSITGNTMLVKAGSAANTMQVLTIGDPAPVFSGNTITMQEQFSSSWGGIIFGPDGMSTVLGRNTGARAGTLSLSAAAGNIMQACSFTAAAANSSSDQTHFRAFEVNLSKFGTPTGNIVARFYSDNAGVPGTLLASGTVPISAASLTTSAAKYAFILPATLITNSAKYWVVLDGSGLTTTASNYVQVDYNATVTAGSSAAGPNSSAWTSDAAKCWVYQIYTGSYGMSPVCDDNIISHQGAATTTAGQLITFGAVNGGFIRRNYVDSRGYYPIVIKDYLGPL